MATFKGDPKTVQVGQKVSFAPTETNNELKTVDSDWQATQHYYGGNGESVNLGTKTRNLLKTSPEQRLHEGKIRNGTTSLTGNYGVNMTFHVGKTTHVGSTPVNYSTTCGSKFCVTDFKGFLDDGVWDILDGNWKVGFVLDVLQPGSSLIYQYLQWK